MLSNSGFNYEKKIQIVIVNNSANINKTNNISQNTKTTQYDIGIQILAGKSTNMCGGEWL